MQSVIATTLVILAIAYLVYRLYRKSKAKKCGGGDCGCK